MGNLRKKRIGTKYFEGTVTVTDPCYNRGSGGWTKEVEVKAGEYECIIWKSREVYTYEGREVVERRVGNIGIYYNRLIPPQTMMEHIGDISVDAGLAGFFMNKPDYNDDEWSEFCDSIRKGDAWIKDEGFFSSSGYGDGVYPVYAIKKHGSSEIIGLEIRFL